MRTLKELRADRAAKAARGLAATTEFNTLAAVAAPTVEQTASLAALETELVALEASLVSLTADIATVESQERRAALFGAPAIIVPAARTAGVTVNEPNPETTGGFHNLAEFALCVRLGAVANQFDPRLTAMLTAATPATFNQNQGGGNEGVLVPTDFRKSIWDLAFDNTDLLGMTNPEPTNSNAVSQPKDETTPWGSAGVQAFWAGEAATYTPSKAQLTNALMNLHKLYAFVSATDELLADAPMLNDRLTRQSGNAIKWKASDSIMWGDGVGQPLGFMKAPSLVTVAKTAGQATATLSIANLLSMMAHVLLTGGRPIWIANQDVIPQLGQLTLGNVPAWLPNNQPIAGNPFGGTLMGYPVYFTEHADTLGNTGDITCANLDGYYSVTKADGGVDFASSIHLYFDQGLTAFRWTFRMAGMPYLSAPIVPARGATNKSHFITLAARP
jgi:HK97 family phage major capsid protein